MAALNYLPHYTYKDYKEWEGRWELINGVPFAMAPMPALKHQIVSNKIGWQLEEKLKNCSKCVATLPVDWKIAEDTIVQPDNLVLCGKIDFSKPYITKTPSIVFEILLPSTVLKDINLKFSLYEREGVKYYVIVNIEEKLAKVYELKDGKYVKVAEGGKFTFEVDCEIEFDFDLIWV